MDFLLLFVSMLVGVLALLTFSVAAFMLVGGIVYAIDGLMAWDNDAAIGAGMAFLITPTFACLGVMLVQASINIFTQAVT